MDGQPVSVGRSRMRLRKTSIAASPPNRPSVESITAAGATRPPGANGSVGAAVCRALVERSAQVRAVVRRGGSAPALDGVTEHVGDPTDEGLARDATRGADAVVTTVHPMDWSREVQHRVGVGSLTLPARVSRDAGVARDQADVTTITAEDVARALGEEPAGDPALPGWRRWLG
ncbi:NADH(P)-binding [Geodermatophilus amargosae]|uniref:NADH(P)-binding n=1 Tax=Geodermatophilus amargosae TaxID=1296565 RepID=A0A1I7BKE8_9ACTN|nr:NAD(P)H-binding protein [Geodermatophilus amargosae]SFT87646.1 NADH(P)-binding [Geodermatophilus amargosae]